MPICSIDWANRQRLPINTRGLSSPNCEGLNWSILRPEEKSVLVDFLSANKTQYRLTKHQTHMVDSYINGVGLMPFDQEHRDAGVRLIARLTKHRKVSSNTIKQVFGLFPKLADEIIMAQNKLDFSKKSVYTIRDETGNNYNS